MITQQDINTLKELDDITQKDTAPSVKDSVLEDISYYKQLKRICIKKIAEIRTDPELKQFFDDELRQGKSPHLVFEMPLNMFDVKINNCNKWIGELEKMANKEIKSKICLQSMSGKE